MKISKLPISQETRVKSCVESVSSKESLVVLSSEEFLHIFLPLLVINL